MGRPNLSDDEYKALADALNQQTEPPEELFPKLFPGIAEKLNRDAQFDFATLEKARIPTIEYAGKRSEAVILAKAAHLGQSAPLQVARSFGDDAEGGWRNLIVQGDNLQFLKACYLNEDPLIKDKVKGQVKLIYIDPPFATKSEFHGKDDERSYNDKVAAAEFLESLRERLIYLREILANEGSIYVHCDSRMSGPIRVILDECFGKSNFLNEIIWCYKERERELPFYNPKHDNIFFYAKNSRNKDRPFNWQAATSEYSSVTRKKFKFDDNDGKGPYQIRGRNLQGSPVRAADGLSKIHEEKYPGLTYRDYLSERNGVAPRDWWEIPIINKAADERKAYPTQKPEELVEQIVRVSSDPDDIVLDVFAGSGTTAAVAEKLGRRWVMCDFGKHAIYTMQERLLNIASSKALDSEEIDSKHNHCPKSFIVLSVGAYDFSKIINLRNNQDAYIDFVLSLFAIPERDDAFEQKFRISNVVATKDGNPVEVYPVWEDEYLKEIKVDEDYLQGIIEQSGGKLKGDYYIIIPETCTLLGSKHVLKNSNSEDVVFNLLKFPYKILEEIARNFSIEEQPSSKANINDLVSSVGFYFNEKVELVVKNTKKALEISHFETGILDKEGNVYEGLSGLALMMIDKDYDGKAFKIDEAVYAADIKEGNVDIDGLTKNTAVIAVDKHGNESEITVVA